jgi:two-component system LytT family sensor kinase
VQLPQSVKSWARQFLIAFAVWSVLALVYGFQEVRATMVMQGRRITLWTALWPAFQTYWIFTLLTPPVIAFSRRVKFQPGGVKRFALMHGAGFVGFVLAQSVLRVLIFSLHDPRTGTMHPRSVALVFQVILFFFSDDIFIYLPLVGMAMAYTAYIQERERELSQTTLRTQLATAELQILKMQLHPHFLFNTLQAISTLVGKDPATAKRMIALLGDLLRAAIDRSGEQEAPLREELDLLERYVQIELVRFGDKLRVNFDIDDNSLNAVVPSLLLQPLVENAIRHGARSLAGLAEVRIGSQARDGLLLLTIDDDGPGLPPPELRNPSGLGLENTRARLRHLYGARHRLELKNRDGGGLGVTIEIPLRAWERGQ